MSFLGKLLGTDKTRAYAESANQNNTAELRDSYNDVYDINSPFLSGGQKAFGELGNYLGLNGAGNQQRAFDSYVEGPDVAIRRAQGINAVDNSYASRTGGTDSGALRKAQMNFGTGLATQNFNTLLQQLAGMSGSGQNAANTVSGARTNTASGVVGANNNLATTMSNASLAEGGFLGNLIGGGFGLAGTLGWNPFGDSKTTQQGTMTGNRFW